MNRIDVDFADIEAAVVAYLTPLLQDATGGVELPPTWTPADGAFVLVACDASTTTYPVLNRATVRLSAFTTGRTAAKTLARTAQRHLLTHRGEPPIGVVVPGAGVVAGRDPDNGADLATCSVIAQQEPQTA